MKKVLIGLTLFVLLMVLGGLYHFLATEKEANRLGTATRKLEIGSSIFEVEIADDSVEQSRGLSGRSSLPENQGMLFVFSDQAIRSFWMRGMNFPLDIIWISGDEIIGFSENLPPANSIDYPLFSPPAPVDKVLEINAGLVKKFGIKIGDGIVLR